jgi:hypothetical protein
MLFWALLAGQITMRKVEGWQTLAEKPSDQIIDLAARSDSLMSPEDASTNSNTTRDGTRLCRRDLLCDGLLVWIKTEAR